MKRDFVGGLVQGSVVALLSMVALVLVIAATARADKREPRTTTSDRLEITNPAGVVKIVIHSDPKPTIEITDDKGKTDKADLVHLIRLANRFGEEKK